MSHVAEQRWPTWTPGRGAGGWWKASPAEFSVVEIPSGTPDGDGEHQWLWIEKTGCTTAEVADWLAYAAGVRRSDVGYAGLKDRDARTEQAFTIMGGRPPEGAPGGVRILRQTRTRHKLRVGSLAGNRFSLLVRGANPGVLRERVRLVSASGFPNYYGVQRLSGGAPERGRDLLLGRRLRLDHAEVKFALSAYQSLLFNTVLARRGSRRLLGDLLDDGAPTGPIYGHQMPWPDGAALALERAVLAEERLPPDAWTAFPDLTRGTRRRLRVDTAVTLSEEAEGHRLEFSLPAGSYATVLLEELLGGDRADQMG